MTAPSRPGLTKLIVDARTGMEQALREEEGVPDFAAMIALASEMDPKTVPSTWVEQAEAMAPVVTMDVGRRMQRDRDDVAMAAVLDQVRAAIDHEVAADLSFGHRHTSRREATPPAAANTHTMRIAWAAAAMVLLAVGVVGALQARKVLRRSSSEPSQAMLTAPAEDSRSLRPVIVPPPRVETKLREHSVVVPEEDPTPVDPPAQTGSIEREEHQPHARRHPRRSPPKQGPSLEERLRELDAQAHRAWRAGRLGEAQTHFEAIVRLGGRHRLADLAYGDLFTLARRTGDTRKETALWRAYLRRFPHGRLADDARAGICRHAKDALPCWSAYLRDFPRGAYRNEASRTAKEASP